MLRIRFIHLSLALMIGLVSTASGGPDEPIALAATASIRATARVVPSLGLTDTHTIDCESATTDLHPEPGSHLFWLYCPKPTGVAVTIESSGDGSAATPVTPELTWLREYDYASVVSLAWEATGPNRAAGDILVTLIYTDN